MVRACKDCKHFKGGIKSTEHTCKAPENFGPNLVTGVTEYRKTPEQLRSAWNSGDHNICGYEGLWWEKR